MPTWNSRGLRGSTLEEFINRTNERYRENHLALIQKVPTPITPIKMDKESRHITLAYFEQKSTVDYIGVVQGIPVCFDAKECQVNTFPHLDRFYYLPFRQLAQFWERMQQGGRKSFRMDELDETFFFTGHSGLLVPYLDALQLDLNLRD